MIRVINALGKLNWGKRAYAVFVLCAATGIALPAQTFTTLHSFGRAQDGEDLYARLVQATNGNLYGTTWLGGKDDGGTVFEITPSGTLTTLYNFCSQTNCADGADPYGGLVQGTDGNFYGTTQAGGRDVDCGGSVSGCGTIFKINSSGTLTTLYTFCPTSPCTDGAIPYGALVQGIDGNFYGTTYYGGIMGSGGLSGFGTLFKITPGGTLTTLHSFVGTDGANPYAALVQGADGNFYGTTSDDGGSIYGTVFKITPSGTLTTLHSFVGTDGRSPQSGLVQGTDGNFYGTTLYGGAKGSCTAAVLCGTVFKITPIGTFTSLYSFCSESGCPDGATPYAGLIQTSDGNFYGTTESGGANGDGTIFKITPTGTLTTLYSFCSQAGCADGSEPYAGLIQASDGNLYGTTYEGGTNNDGTVFRLAFPAGSQVPAILNGGIVNAASYAQANGVGSPVAPGSLVAIFTSTLSAQPANFTTATLPPSLGGASVTFNGITAPMVAVSPAGQYPYVSAQVPFEVLPPGQASANVPVVITVNGVPSPAVQASIVASQPGIFTIPATGQGNAILTFLNPATNQPAIAAPASAGISYPTAPIPRGTGGFFYVTGLGAMTPSVPDGSGTCPASNGLCTANATPQVLIGGISAPVAFAGQAPGFPGVFQVNITVPQNAPTGSTVSLVVKSADGTVTSNTATIAVQ